MDDAHRLLSETPTHPMANAFIGLEILRTAEEGFVDNSVQNAREHLEIAVKSDQYRDSFDYLARALSLNVHLFEPWYNLGVLYDLCTNQHDEAVKAFIECLERAPELLNVQARVDAQKAYIEDDDLELFNDSLIEEMIETPLSDQYYKVHTMPASDDHFTLDPLRQDTWEDNNADKDSSEDTTTVVISEAPTTTLAEVSTSATITVDEGTTIKLLITVAEESITTSVAEATTTSFPPIITNRIAFRTDNDETLETWLQTYNTNNHLTSDKSIALGHATFGLEPGTSCLSATSPNGSQLFAQISFPNSNKYTFIFTTKKNVDNLSWYDFITYSESADGYLDCESETSHTPSYWYYSDDVKVYYMQGSPTLFDYPSVKFKFVIGDT
ncbi:hypothetical protein HZS61_016029 [Fusarium oxysporum f. sp. conglutinans]|uniref:Uncharacterized protein n=1 Tax=Fusarium oxysporum f. sp. conglutinans TaxID=100902 RepID=A0A8H6GJP3_FUSOX|nr:hypothetical protein HZS61_016029 [Fusarium oxysporum f. sp. conglutinans]